ncbi:hypothetical protein CRENBAI_017853 [Crenichthys baileyi]|uniref:Uncharacterized protein n=1 Tax=Crenichthys baileyi TaxID=28760 RepID=A0AAV9RXC5_9TELE
MALLCRLYLLKLQNDNFGFVQALLLSMAEAKQRLAGKQTISIKRQRKITKEKQHYVLYVLQTSSAPSYYDFFHSFSEDLVLAKLDVAGNISTFCVHINSSFFVNSSVSHLWLKTYSTDSVQEGW